MIETWFLILSVSGASMVPLPFASKDECVAAWEQSAVLYSDYFMRNEKLGNVRAAKAYTGAYCVKGPSRPIRARAKGENDGN